MPKKWGGKEAVASVEPGGPREAAQVSGFRGAGNNSITGQFVRKDDLSGLVSL